MVILILAVLALAAIFALCLLLAMRDNGLTGSGVYFVKAGAAI